MAPTTEAELAELLAERFARRAPLRIVGGGTRTENRGPGDALGLARLAGVVTYSPGEMTLVARAGTPLPEIMDMLAAEGQSLAFEPPDLRTISGAGGVPTIGGMVAANASGPRRLSAGACRDHLLGVRFVDGQGRTIKNGGRVMKNVTGLDLSKLMAGAHGTLGVLTEVSMKTLPLSAARATLAFAGTDAAAAVAIFTAALATPFEISGAAWRDGTAFLRIEGLGPQLDYRRDRLLALFPDRKPDLLERTDSDRLWRDLRDAATFAASPAPLWRILTRPSEAPALSARLTALGGQVALDWGGGLIWYQGPGEVAQIRSIARHATLIRRGGLTGPAFPPPFGPVAQISNGLRQRFDPAGILNPGLMDS
ncbi:MAG: glycolate oxidase subunit GlcE [Paracoccus sp. (in: a-proteobacteria)]